MAKYEILYEKTSTRRMTVEASSIEEAKKKYEDFDCIDDVEDYGIDEKIEEIKLISS